MTPEARAQATHAQRWLARLSLVPAGLAIVILVVFAGLRSLARFAIGVAAAVVSVPVTCTVWPGALRVWVPRDSPSGVPGLKPAVSWARLRRVAGGRRDPAEATR
jgi:hypothetical protein